MTTEAHVILCRVRDSLGQIERILSQAEFESLEQRVKAHNDALKAMHKFLRDLTREVDRQLKELRKGQPHRRY